MLNDDLLGDDLLSDSDQIAVAHFYSLLEDLRIIDRPVETEVESWLDRFQGLPTSDLPELKLSQFNPTTRNSSHTDGVAFTQLQNLLVDPKLIEIQTKLAQLHDQLYEPNQLVELLLPLISDLIQRKVNQSREDLVQAIAPILDQIVQSRADQDQESLGIALSAAIPSAIAHQVTMAPDQIATAIAPTMGQAIKRQVAIDQDEIVDALYPIIGGTISKYLAETIREINQQVENTLSPKGIQRKIRARLQGVSEAELILRESVPFAVQAVFLIHKASGLVIAEVQRSDDHRLESELIAGMLTAIRSFANDCIVQSTSELNEIDYGASKIILEVAGYCYLAIVVRGAPPKSFIVQVRHALSHLVQHDGATIEQFDGDPEQVTPSIYNTLSTLLETPIDAQSSQKPPVLAVFGLGLAAILSVQWGMSAYHSHLRHQIETALAETPELAVYHLTAKINWNQFKLHGRLPNAPLRHKAETVARSTLPNWAIDNQISVIDVPADPVQIAQAVKTVTTVLNQMVGISIAATSTNAQVTVEGTVSQASDAKKIMQAYQQIAGVKSVLSAVRVRPLIKEIRFYFQPNSSKPDSTLGTQLKAFLQLHRNRTFKVIGYSSDLSLALARANTVRGILINQKISPTRLQISASDTLPPNISDRQLEQLRRTVILEAIVDPG